MQVILSLAERAQAHWLELGRIRDIPTHGTSSPVGQLPVPPVSSLPVGPRAVHGKATAFPPKQAVKHNTSHTLPPVTVGEVAVLTPASLASELLTPASSHLRARSTNDP